MRQETAADTDERRQEDDGRGARRGKFTACEHAVKRCTELAALLRKRWKLGEGCMIDKDVLTLMISVFALGVSVGNLLSAIFRS